ncbi:MAG: hypothetical protein E4G98_07395, partial [Promethearchaeota archaeon]
MTVVSPSFYFPTDQLTSGEITVNFRTYRQIHTDWDYLPDDAFQLEIILYDEDYQAIEILEMYNGLEQSFSPSSVQLTPSLYDKPRQLHVGLRVTLNTGYYNLTFGDPDSLFYAIRGISVDMNYNSSWGVANHLNQWAGFTFEQETQLLDITATDLNFTVAGSGGIYSGNGQTVSTANLSFIVPVDFTDPQYTGMNVSLSVNSSVFQSILGASDGLGYYRVHANEILLHEGNFTTTANDLWEIDISSWIGDSMDFITIQFTYWLPRAGVDVDSYAITITTPQIHIEDLSESHYLTVPIQDLTMEFGSRTDITQTYQFIPFESQFIDPVVFPSIIFDFDKSSATLYPDFYLEGNGMWLRFAVVDFTSGTQNVPANVRIDFIVVESTQGSLTTVLPGTDQLVEVGTVNTTFLEGTNNWVSDRNFDFGPLFSGEIVVLTHRQSRAHDRYMTSYASRSGSMNSIPLAADRGMHIGIHNMDLGGTGNLPLPETIGYMIVEAGAAQIQNNPNYYFVLQNSGDTIKGIDNSESGFPIGYSGFTFPPAVGIAHQVGMTDTDGSFAVIDSLSATEMMVIALESQYVDSERRRGKEIAGMMAIYKTGNIMDLNLLGLPTTFAPTGTIGTRSDPNRASLLLEIDPLLVNGGSTGEIFSESAIIDSNALGNTLFTGSLDVT